VIRSASSPLPTTTISDVDRYLFDLNGYVVIPGALDPATVARLTAILEANCATQEREHPGRTHFGISPLLQASPELRALIDHEPVFTYLEEWLGRGFRLDHAYGLVMRDAQGGAPHIHGGGTPFHPSRSYACQNGHIYSAETAVSYALTDVAPGEGGFGVVPASHKANFPLPWAADPGPYPDGTVTQVPVKAGSAIIFTESLTHCSLPWTGRGSRRALFYKYTPRNIQVSKSRHDLSLWPELSERQRGLLEPAHT
jgi:hypothetical protein